MHEELSLIREGVGGERRVAQDVIKDTIYE